MKSEVEPVHLRDIAGGGGKMSRRVFVLHPVSGQIKLWVGSVYGK